jgi:K+-transporting ATPase A subunit
LTNLTVFWNQKLVELATSQLIVDLGGTIGVSIPFGLYLARMISYEMRPLEAPLARVENGFYKIIGIDKNKQMTWKEYALALIVTSLSLSLSFSIDGLILIILLLI